MLDPDRVYRKVAYRRDDDGVGDQFVIVARPGEAPRVAPAGGDLLVRVELGLPGLGYVAKLSGPALGPAAAFEAEDLSAERAGPGSYAVVVDHGGPQARRVLDDSGRVPLGQLLLRPRNDRPARDDLANDLAAEGDEYEDIVERIRRELALRFTDPDDPRLLDRRRRLRALFGSVPPTRALELVTRLGARPTGDELSKAFHGRLATATRTELMKILRARVPVDAKPSQPERPPAQPPPTRNPCRREVGSMTTLRPWERAMLALANSTNESDFNGVGILVGPVLPMTIVDPWVAVIVKTALRYGYAITIGNNVWFPSSLDTSNIDDLVLLVHESVHVRDYALVGIEAFLKSYAMKAVAAGFSHDKIPDERRANLTENAARLMLDRSPRLVSLIRSCDSDAILAELRRSKETYRAAFNQALGDTPGETIEAEREASKEDAPLEIGGSTSVARGNDFPRGGSEIEEMIARGVPENAVTDAVFFGRNPHLPRRPLEPGSELARQWRTIREGEVRPAAKRMLRPRPVDLGLLATFFSQYENDDLVPADAKEAFLTGVPLLSLGRTLRDRVLSNWRAGHRPLTPRRFYDLAFGVTGDPGTSLLLCHNVAKALAKGGQAINWRRTAKEGEYTDGTNTYTAKVVHPNGRLTYHRDAQKVRSIYYLLFAATEMGTDDPGDWYHYFVAATMAFYGASPDTRSPSRSVSEQESNGRGGVIGFATGSVYEELVRNAIFGLEQRMSKPALRGDPGYRGWILANAIGFLEGGYYGGSQSEVSRESRWHLRGAVFGVRLAGGSPRPAWRWHVPITQSINKEDLVGGFSLSAKTAEVLNPKGDPVRH